MANQDVDQGKIKGMEQNSNRGQSTGVAGPMMRINQESGTKKNPMSKGKIKFRK